MGYEIQSIMKAVQVLLAFDEKHVEYGVHELSRKLGIHRSTVHRILMTLEKCGFMIKNQENEKYSLGYKLFELGNLVTPIRELCQRSEKYMAELVEKTNESANLVVYDHGKALYVNRKKGSHKLQMIEKEGGSIPLYCTAVGKVILAHMEPENVNAYLEKCQLVKFTDFTITDPEQIRKECEKVRASGIAVDHQELEIGCRCIAAPVKDAKGKVIAAIAISGSTARITTRKTVPFGQIVAKIAADFSESLGYLT